MTPRGCEVTLFVLRAIRFPGKVTTANMPKCRHCFLVPKGWKAGHPFLQHELQHHGHFELICTYQFQVNAIVIDLSQRLNPAVNVGICQRLAASLWFL